MPEKVRCDYEHSWFPRNDFDTRKEYGLVHSKNLNGEPEHTNTGLVIDGDPWTTPGQEERF